MEIPRGFVPSNLMICQNYPMCMYHIDEINLLCPDSSMTDLFEQKGDCGGGQKCIVTPLLNCRFLMRAQLSASEASRLN